MERSQVVHPGHVGPALGEVELLPRLLHPGVEIADDRLGATDDLALELDLEPEHPVGRRVLRAHVEDHPLVLVDPVVEHVVVLDHPAELLVEPGLDSWSEISCSPSSVGLNSGSSVPATQRSRVSVISGLSVRGLAHLKSPDGFP